MYDGGYFTSEFDYDYTLDFEKGYADLNIIDAYDEITKYYGPGNNVLIDLIDTDEPCDVNVAKYDYGQEGRPTIETVTVSGHPNNEYNGLYLKYDRKYFGRSAFKSCDGTWIFIYSWTEWFTTYNQWRFHLGRLNFNGAATENFYGGGIANSPKGYYDYRYDFDGDFPIRYSGAVHTLTMELAEVTDYMCYRGDRYKPPDYLVTPGDKEEEIPVLDNKEFSHNYP